MVFVFEQISQSKI